MTNQKYIVAIPAIVRVQIQLSILGDKGNRSRRNREGEVFMYMNIYIHQSHHTTTDYYFATR